MCGVVVAVIAGCGGGGTTVDATPDFFGDAPLDALTYCAPLAAAGAQGCGSAEKCGWIRVQDTPSIVGQLGCVPAGNRAVGEACARGDTGAATGFDDCVAGAVCVGAGAAAVCAPLCDPAAVPLTCASGETCKTADLGGNGGPGMPILGACTPT